MPSISIFGIASKKSVPTATIQLIPFALVKVRSPPTDDPLITIAVVPLFNDALPAEPVVFKDTAPFNTFELPRRISASAAEVVKEDVLATVITPVSSIFPVVAVAVNIPPTFEVAKSIPTVLTTVADPEPFVFRVIFSVEAVTARLSRVITPLLALVVAERSPVTVTVPLTRNSVPARSTETKTGCHARSDPGDRASS